MARTLFTHLAITGAVFAISGCATNAPPASNSLVANHATPELARTETDAAPPDEPTEDQTPIDEPSPIRLVGQIDPVAPVANADIAWWQSSVSGSLRRDATPMQVSVEDLLVRSLQHSSQVKVFSELPLIRETSVVEADAAFDWHGFLDSRWDDISDPVGNSLTVGGGQNRFNDHNLSGSAGARRRTRNGGQLEVAQRLGWQDNNSTFFIPGQQGTSRLVLSLSLIHI